MSEKLSWPAQTTCKNVDFDKNEKTECWFPGPSRNGTEPKVPKNSGDKNGPKSTWCRSNGSTRAMRIKNDVTRYDWIILVKEKYMATVLVVVSKSRKSICIDL